MSRRQHAGWRHFENRAHAASILATAAAAGPAPRSRSVEVSVRALDEPRRLIAVSAVEEVKRSQRSSCGNFEERTTAKAAALAALSPSHESCPVEVSVCPLHQPRHQLLS